MKQHLWLTGVTALAFCIDKELYKAIDYLKEQVHVLLEQQEKQHKRILLTNRQRMRLAANEYLYPTGRMVCFCLVRLRLRMELSRYSKPANPSCSSSQ